MLIIEVVQLSSFPSKERTPLSMWIFSLSLSIRTLSVSSSLFPTSFPLRCVWTCPGAEISEPFPTPSLLLSPLAHLGLSLLVVWVKPQIRWQLFPLDPYRWFRCPHPVIKPLRVFFEAISVSIMVFFSVVQWGQPLMLIIANRVIVRWRSSMVKFLLVGMIVMHIGIIWENWGSSLASWIHIFSEEIQMFCVIFSPAQGIPVQFKTFVIQVRFFERKPAKKKNNPKD